MFLWFLECSMTTFLHSHHSFLAKLGQWGWLMRMRLAWKKSRKTLDTSKILHQNKTRSTGSAGKGLHSQLCHYWNGRLGNGQGHHSREGPGRGWNQYSGAPPTTVLLFDPSPSQRIIYKRPPSRPHQIDLLWHAEWGASIITQTLHGYPFTRPRSRSRAWHVPFWEQQLYKILDLKELGDTESFRYFTPVSDLSVIWQLLMEILYLKDLGICERTTKEYQ